MAGESELVEIRTKLAEDDCRLLTLLGPGGSGKTRLAIDAAEGLLADYQHGVFFVNLTPVQSVEMIPSTIASALRYFYEKGHTQPAADRLLAEKADAADPGQFRTPVGRCLFL